jgi:signal transduction histidine kinase
VLFARRWPAGAAMALAAGALLNEIVIGPMVRCGVMLPVLFLIAFQFGAVGPTLRRSMLALGVTAWVGVAAMELAWDPVLDSSAAVIIAALGGGFFCAGMLIRSRTGMVTSLRLRTEELRAQRDRTAALEVAADRIRVGADLERLIRTQVQQIAAHADLARAAVDDEPARAALVEVEQSGRETLARMRDVVGGLRDAPTAPPPGLDQLADLLKRATTADARMTIHGRARPLTTNLELSAYRIIEQLLTTLLDHPGIRVDVAIRFTDDALEIQVSGPTARSSGAATESGTALLAVRARAELHGGTVVVRNPVNRSSQVRDTQVRLPLLAGSRP